MKLQIAIDVADTMEALEIVGKIHDIIDIVEIGTPMIIREGLAPVRAIKDRFPGVTVLADTKIVDGGELECRYACDAGADIVTVLAIAADETIESVAATARKNGRASMADLISVSDIAARSREVERLGVDYICVHTAVDVQKKGRTPLGDLRELVSAIPPGKSAVAGGISLKTIGEYRKLAPAIVISGGALTGAADIRAAVAEMASAIR
jgi:3-hexulose-6-phosphate synthase